MAATTDTFGGFYVAATVVLVIFLLKRILFGGHKTNLPPGPPGLPVIGILHKMSPQPHQTFAEMARQYGPLISFRVGQMQCMVASSPHTAVEFLKNQDANFSDRPSLRVSEVLELHSADIVLANNTPIWRHMRRIFTTELTSAKRIEASRHVREEEISHMLRTISCEKQEVKLITYLATATTNIVSRMVLNKRLDGATEFRDLVDELSQCVSAFNLRDFIPAFKVLDVQGLETRFKKLVEHMDSFMKPIISEHVERRKTNSDVSEQDKDMVDILLDEMEVTEGTQIKEAHIKGVIWDAFTAGTETNAILSEWAMAEVMRNSDVMEKAHAELDAVVGRTSLVQESDISKLKYLQAIIKETFRLHPPLPLLVPHQSINDCKAFGYDIPAKTRLFVNVWAIGRDASVWDNPLEFKPERFLEGRSCEGIDFQGKHFALLPFGSGRRSCPGMAMAITISHSLVANLLHAFEWSLPEDMDVKDMDMSEGLGISCPKAVPLSAMARPRIPTHLYQ